MRHFVYNPANLALSDGPRWSVSLVGLTVGGTSGGARLQDYANFLASLGDEEAFLDLASQRGTFALELDAHASALAIQSGTFALGVTYHAVARQTAKLDLLELYVHGPDPDRRSYAVAGSSIAEADHLDIAAGYGFALGPVRFGVTAHYLHGRRLASRSAVGDRTQYDDHTDPATGEVLWDEWNAEIDYRDLVTDGGSGYAVDLGLAWKPAQRWTVSGAMSGLISRMGWGELREYRMTGSEDDLFELERFAIEEPEGAGVPVAAGDAEAEALAALGRLPRTLRLGGAYQPLRRVQLAASYQRQLSEGDLVGGWRDVLSAGAELNLPVLPLTVRGGYALASNEARIFAFGASALGVHVGLAQMKYGGGTATHEHWTATASIAFSGRRPWGRTGKR